MDVVFDFVGLAGLPMVAGTLVYVARQTTMLTRSNHAVVYQHIASLMIEVDRLFVDKPELRPYFYGGASIPTTEPDRSQVLAVAETLVDFFDDFVQQSDEIPGLTVRSWYRYVDFMGRNSPALREFWLANANWYEIKTQEVLDVACSFER